MNVIAFGAHPDDCETGCGATLHLMASRGHDIRVIAFSGCEDEVPEGWSPETLREECFSASKILGAKSVAVLSYPNKALESRRQEMLDLMYGLKDETDLVFCPSSFNSNQDHQTVFREAKRAFRDASILGYLTASSDYGSPSSAVYQVVGKEDVDAKLKALEEYRSQKFLKRPYFEHGYFEAQMTTWGIEVWRPYAEKFELVRGIMR